MIIGVTGKYCAGKDAVADILKEKSLYHYSLSDAIREELRKQGKPITRENLIHLGTHLRETRGAGILAEMTLRNLKSDKNYIITSIRNPGEVRTLRQRKDFMLINVDAPIELRFQRLKNRPKATTEDKAINSVEDLRAFEAREMTANPAGQQLHKVGKMADVTLKNDSDLDALRTKLGKLLTTWSPKLQLPRPSWDEYFMNIARAVASRSNCVKRKVAAVVVKDKRIISTGYNGTPRGARNCNEGGCKRCNTYAASGSGLGDCTCSHGEENAIVQAAYHGVSLKDGTLYSTLSPCIMCTKMIINAGIKEVVYNLDYPLPDSAKSLFKEARIKVRRYHIG